MFRLGVDVGTSSTVAVLAWPDVRRRPLLFDGSPLLPSAVFAEPDGRLLTGRDALRAARVDPAGLEPNPKRHIGEGSVLLGPGEVPVGDLLAATLRTVWRETLRTTGGVVPSVVLTCPATWGSTARRLLVAAAGSAGLPPPALVAEPIAAATYFGTVLGHQVPAGHGVVVYDLGAGTFDVSGVLRHPAGFETRACDGVPALGGLDLDALVVDLVLAALPGPQADRLRHQEPALARWQLWEEARQTREALSRHPVATCAVGATDRTVHVTREQFETAAEPLLRRTVDLTVETLRGARAELAGIFLVGGATRTPLVATLLHRATGVAPLVLEQPELVVAEGALLAAPWRPDPQPRTPPPLVPAAAGSTRPCPGRRGRQLHRGDHGPGRRGHLPRSDLDGHGGRDRQGQVGQRAVHGTVTGSMAAWVAVAVARSAPVTSTRASQAAAVAGSPASVAVRPGSAARRRRR